MECNTSSEQMIVLAAHPIRGLEFVRVDIQVEMGLMQHQDKYAEAIELASAGGYLPIVAFATDDPAGKQILGISLIKVLGKAGIVDAITDKKASLHETEMAVGLDQCHLQLLQSETLKAACSNLNRAYHESKIANYGNLYQTSGA